MFAGVMAGIKSAGVTPDDRTARTGTQAHDTVSSPRAGSKSSGDPAISIAANKGRKGLSIQTGSSGNPGRGKRDRSAAATVQIQVQDGGVSKKKRRNKGKKKHSDAGDGKGKAGSGHELVITHRVEAEELSLIHI